MKTETDPNIIKLKGVRLSYPALFTPKENTLSPGKPPTFQATFLLDKKVHRELIVHIEKSIDRVALDFFHKKVPLKHRGLRDGNEKSDSDGYGDGIMFIGSNSDKRPVVVDTDLTPLTEADGKIYAGCYVDATIRLFAYDHKVGGKGVSAGLRAVRFMKDGDAFGAGPVNAEDEFDDVETASVDDY